MATEALRPHIERAIGAYIRGCNAADAAAIAACFRRDVVHYGPGAPKLSGAAAIGEYFATRVAQSGEWWSVDHMLVDTERCEAVLEWTRFNPTRRQIVRGVDWFVFDGETALIREIRPYFAARPDPDLARQEQQEFDYAARGYPVDFPEGGRKSPL